MAALHRKTNKNTAERADVKNKGRIDPRTRSIIWALAFSLAVVFGIMIYNYTRTYQNARSDVLELSKSSSIRNAEAIELFFTRHEDVLLATAEIMEYGLATEEVSVKDLELLLHNMSEAYNESIYKRYADKDFTGIYASVNGTLIHAYKGADDLPAGYDPLERQWYIEGVEGGGSVVFGEPYYDVYDPDIQVMTATKLLSDGETVVGMDITLKDMQYAGGNMDVSVTLNGQKHDYGHGLILTDHGVVMAHWDGSEQGKCYAEPGSPMYGVFQKIIECTDNEEDYLETDIDGVTYGIFPQKLNNGWYVVTLTDLEDIRTTISDFSMLLLASTATIVLLGAVYCIIIFRAYIRSDRLSKNLQGALKLAKVDSLTNVGNRTAYDMRVRELLERMNTEDDEPFAVVMMDLNDLKYVNDHLGHTAGDRYIQNCCSLVQNIFTSDLYRIGGDEFAMFLLGEEYEHWKELCDRLRLAVEAANSCLTPSVEAPSIAIGIAAHAVESGDDMEALLRKADAEMYANKVAIKQARLEDSGKGYNEDLNLKLLDRQMLVSEIQKGLDEEQFEIHFQPQVNYENNGSLIGAEALVRWNHPKRGAVSPAVFVPLFEYNGLVYDLDKYVWEHTCACIRRWIDDGMSPLPVSVNVSRYDIIQPDFMDNIVAIVEKYQLPYDLVHLEVTESAFSDDTGRVAETVKKLIDRGFIIAIDDFGSGYSSLSLLRNIPAHIVKLDMRFFANGENQSRNECIIESIIRMVKMLGMGVIAEGVEHMEQAECLYRLGCAYIQGYLYSKPLPYDEYVEYVKAAVSERVMRPDARPKMKLNTESARSQQLFHSIISGTSDAIIVADRKTRQLLYANRAAEQYFGKRFDPLKPTTCMQYCGRKELCENCPASGMKPGERREFEYFEKGRHIKSLYTQMNWNGRDAFVLYQTDVSVEVQSMEFANSLLDNLGVGIVIFRGDAPTELTPVFCNREYMQMSGLTHEQFLAEVTKDYMYGVHPDDIAEAREMFVDAFQNGRSMRCHLRVKKATGAYEWVSMHAQIKRIENGSFEAYTVFWDAEEEMQKRATDVGRYRNFIKQTAENAKASLSTMHFNLTKDICESIYRSLSVNRPVVFENGINGYIESAVGNIADDAIKAEFAATFSRAALLKSFEGGVFANTMRLPIRLTDQRIIWCYQDVRISRNPGTGDIEAITTLTEADRNIRLNGFYRNIIQGDYELIGSIDVQTGFVTIISEPVSHGLPNLYGSAVHYMENLATRMNVIVDDDFVDACIEAISFETILKKLEAPEDYICIFPAKRSLMGEGIVFRWRFGYANASKNEIIFTRMVLR